MEHQSDLERMLFFEHARKTTEANYSEDPLDVENLTRWGGALVELSQFQIVVEAKKMLLDGAMLKFDEALMIDPNMFDALCWMANANASYALLTPDADEAKPYFDKAVDYISQAINEDYMNDLYRKSLKLASYSYKLPSKNPKKSSGLKYDIFGWVILDVAFVAWMLYAKSNMPPPPPG